MLHVERHDIQWLQTYLTGPGYGQNDPYPKMTKRPPSSTGWLQVWRCIMFSQIRSWCLRTTYARVVDDRQLFIPKFCSYGQRFLQFTDVESGTFDHETRYNDERSRFFCWTSSSNFEILGNRYVQIPCSKILIWWLQWHWYNVIGPKSVCCDCVVSVAYIHIYIYTSPSTISCRAVL